MEDYGKNHDKGIKLWFKRNVEWFFILGVVLIALGVGIIIGMIVL